MPVKVALAEGGIVIYNNGQKVLLDPKKDVRADLAFLSHAHTDHMIRNVRKNTNGYKKKILASRATSYLAHVRGMNLGPDYLESCDGYGLIDTCHILGSRGLLIADRLY